MSAAPDPSSTSSVALVSSMLQNLAFGPRGVVLGLLADPLEQLGAPGVVEMLRRELLERAREPVEDVVGEASLVGGRDARADADAVRVENLLHASLAIRNPAKIWLRCGRSQLRNLGFATRARVAHDPPRSTL